MWPLAGSLKKRRGGHRWQSSVLRYAREVHRGLASDNLLTKMNLGPTSGQAEGLSIWLVLGLIMLVFLSSPEARGEGFRNPYHNPAAMGQGNAFTAQADDASAVFYNPAGMTQLPGIQFLLGVEFININTHFRSFTGATTENDLGGPFGFPPPGQLFLTARPRDFGATWLGDLTVGLGLQNLFGIGYSYPSDGPLQTAITDALLPLLDIKPTLAYRFSEWLALGIGGDIFTFWDSVLGGAKQKFISPGLPGIAPGDHVKITGTGTTAGFNVSALVTPLRTKNGAPRVNLGFIYRSQSDLPLDGKLRVNGVGVAESRSSLHFPDGYTVGLAVWPVRDQEREWKVETDIDYIRWSTVRKLEFRFSNGLVLGTPQSWRNTVHFGIGTEYKWLNWSYLPSWDFTVRAGYNHVQTPIPAKNFNPAFPDANTHVIAMGTGLTCRPGGRFLGIKDCGKPGEGNHLRELIGVDVSYQLSLVNSRTVTGNPNPVVNGRYRTTGHTLALSLRLGF
jgi:long-chain fatty acid transport protein